MAIVSFCEEKRGVVLRQNFGLANRPGGKGEWSFSQASGFFEIFRWTPCYCGGAPLRGSLTIHHQESMYDSFSEIGHVVGYLARFPLKYELFISVGAATTVRETSGKRRASIFRRSYKQLSGLM